MRRRYWCGYGVDPPDRGEIVLIRRSERDERCWRSNNLADTKTLGYSIECPGIEDLCGYYSTSARTQRLDQHRLRGIRRKRSGVANYRRRRLGSSSRAYVVRKICVGRSHGLGG